MYVLAPIQLMSLFWNITSDPNLDPLSHEMFFLIHNMVVSAFAINSGQRWSVVRVSGIKAWSFVWVSRMKATIKLGQDRMEISPRELAHGKSRPSV